MVFMGCLAGDLVGSSGRRAESFGTAIISESKREDTSPVGGLWRSTPDGGCPEKLLLLVEQRREVMAWRVPEPAGTQLASAIVSERGEDNALLGIWRSFPRGETPRMVGRGRRRGEVTW